MVGHGVSAKASVAAVEAEYGSPWYTYEIFVTFEKLWNKFQCG